MNTIGPVLGGGLGVAIILFLLILAILWFVLPFAVFGTKPKLDETNKLLKEIVEHLNTANQYSAENRHMIAKIMVRLKIPE
jgi:hypothetical protein